MKFRKMFLLLTAAMLITACAGAEPLFDPAKAGIYNYCPSAFVEGGIVHMYYCTNVDSRVVVDHIGYRTSQDGQAYSPESIVLEHSEGKNAWDTVHVCDPDVIKGRFLLDGEEYHYLMAYLGCTTTNNQENKVGLAVAKSPEGPFIKLSETEPFVDFIRDTTSAARNASFQWGVGQPSLVSMDKAGKVMLIYTCGSVGGTWLICEKWDLSDLDHPVPLGENWKSNVSNIGAKGRLGESRNLNNADFVYDPVKGVMYVTAEGAPGYIKALDDPGEPTFVSSTVRVLKYSQICPPDAMEDFFASGVIGRWTEVRVIGKEDTGYPRNHNTGFLSDPYGWLQEEDKLQVLYSSSDVGKANNSLWTYRIHQWTVPLE